MPCLDLDLHRLELPFAGVRLVEPRAVEWIARSIERGGQIVPCIAVANPPAEAWEASEGLVLMMAIDALRLCGRSAVNTARVECWWCDLAEALLAPLTGSQSRPFTAIEEALRVRELVQGLGLSQHDLARRRGPDASWVNRRPATALGAP